MRGPNSRAGERARVGVHRDPKGYVGFMALYWCAFRGLCSPETPRIADLLVAAGADPNAATNTGETVLCLAVDSGNNVLVRQLLCHGSDPNLRSNGVTPLMRAAASGSEELVRILLDAGAEWDAVDGRFRAYDYAMHYGHDNIARLLAAAELAVAPEPVQPRSVDVP